MAVSNLRVEARAPQLACLYWDQTGSNALEVYRSTNGTDYTLLASFAKPDPLTYEDATASAATRYWYKISDDSGSSFSSAVNVTTHTCPTFNRGERAALPRFAGSEQEPDKLNDLVQMVEEKLNKTFFYGSASPSPHDQCTVCATNGAIVLDC